MVDVGAENRIEKNPLILFCISDILSAWVDPEFTLTPSI